MSSPRGRPGGAFSLFIHALELDPSFALAAFNRGSSLSALGRLDDAIDVCNVGLSRRPDLADAWYFKGRALLDSGHPDAAVLGLEKALEWRADFEGAYGDPHRARAQGTER